MLAIVLLASMPFGLVQILAFLLAIVLAIFGLRHVYSALVAAQGASRTPPAGDIGAALFNLVVGSLLLFAAWFAWTHWV